MITTPAVCRLRKLGCALTAKVKIAPMASKVRQLAVLRCDSFHRGPARRDQGSRRIRRGYRITPPPRLRVRGAQLRAQALDVPVRQLVRHRHGLSVAAIIYLAACSQNPSRALPAC
jgi:hypothetical protein